MLLRLRALPGLAGWGLRFLRECRRGPLAGEHARRLRAGHPQPRRVPRTCARRSRASRSTATRRACSSCSGDRSRWQSALRAAGLYPSSACRSPPSTRTPAYARSRRSHRSGSGSPAASSTRPTRAATPTSSPARSPPAARASGSRSSTASRSRPRERARPDHGVHAPSAGRLAADAIVLALGPLSPAVARTLGLRLPIYPAKGYSVTVEVDGWNRAPRRPIADDGRKAAVVPLGRRVRVAGTVEFAGHDTRLDAARGRMLLEALADILPDCPRDGRVEHWAGLRPLTPDGRPILGPTRWPTSTSTPATAPSAGRWPAALDWRSPRCCAPASRRSTSPLSHGRGPRPAGCREAGGVLIAGGTARSDRIRGERMKLGLFMMPLHDPGAALRRRAAGRP